MSFALTQENFCVVLTRTLDTSHWLLTSCIPSIEVFRKLYLKKKFSRKNDTRCEIDIFLVQAGVRGSLSWFWLGGERVGGSTSIR